MGKDSTLHFHSWNDGDLNNNVSLKFNCSSSTKSCKNTEKVRFYQHYFCQNNLSHVLNGICNFLSIDYPILFPVLHICISGIPCVTLIGIVMTEMQRYTDGKENIMKYIVNYYSLWCCTVSYSTELSHVCPTTTSRRVFLINKLCR